MKSNALGIRLLIALLFSLVLTILPLPELVTGFRPSWIILFVLYVQFFLPNYFNTLLLFLLGVCIDVLLSTVLGEHAFALLLTSLFATSKARRFKFFSLSQQMILIALFCFCYQLIIFLIDSFMGYKNELLVLLVPPFLSMLLWPWIRLFGDSKLRHTGFTRA